MENLPMENLPWQNFIKRYGCKGMRFALIRHPRGDENGCGNNIFNCDDFKTRINVVMTAAMIQTPFILSLNAVPDVDGICAAFAPAKADCICALSDRGGKADKRGSYRGS